MSNDWLSKAHCSLGEYLEGPVSVAKVVNISGNQWLRGMRGNALAPALSEGLMVASLALCVVLYTMKLNLLGTKNKEGVGV